jgi:ubiquinone/menaquinone biosynthesis C-methylase UbiE
VHGALEYRRRRNPNGGQLAQSLEINLNPSSTFVAADGDGYELNMGRWSKRLARPFLEFVGTGDGEVVLDAGCGTGHLAAAVAELSNPRQVHGVDLSPVYVDYAKAHSRDDRRVFTVGDVCSLAYPDHHFDRVLSLLVLHFVPRADEAIAEMRRVARPGAVVGAAVWDARGGFVANRMFFDTAAAIDPKASLRRAKNYSRPMTRPGELATAWRAAGFREVAETLLCMRMEYASFADYWAPYLGKDGPGAEYVGTLNDEQRTRLEAVVRDAYLDGEADGPRSYAALAWAVRGVAP